MISLHHGDCREIIPTLGVMVDAVVTDPPYHLLPTLTRFGAADSAPAQHGRDGAMARLSGGFMGQQWDGGDIAFRPETWATVATILRPGAFLVAFGGTRSSHRMISAIEDAGFIIQDKLLWMFATGFPKRKDMLKPAYEDICLAYKPGGKRTMQIDECRIATAESLNGGAYAAQGSRRPLNGDAREGAALGLYQAGKTVGKGFEQPPGRWPANVCHDDSGEVVACFPESAGQQYAVKGDERRGQGQVFEGFANPLAFEPRNDTGSAARFFMSAKAGPQDRWGSRHPTVKPVDLIAWLVALVTPPGGTFLDCFAGSGTAAVAALKTGRNAILIEREQSYYEDIKARIAHYEGAGQHSLAAKGRKAAPEKLGAKGTPLFAFAASLAEASE